EGTLSATGALAADTGRFTGRSPQDRFIVRDKVTADRVSWNETNQPISEANFDRLLGQVAAYLEARELYVNDVAARSGISDTLSIRVVTESAYQSVFCNNMFLAD